MPIYLIFQQLGLLDTWTGIIAMFTLMNLPIVVWMLYSFFREVPKEILEASRMDGATPMQQMRLLLLPLSLPGVMSTALLSIILCWNEAFWSINLTSVKAAPLTAVDRQFFQSRRSVLVEAVRRLHAGDRADPRLWLAHPATTRPRPDLRRRQVEVSQWPP